MTLLPIVERELRVAARKPGSHWVRALAALAAMAGCGWALLVSRRVFASAQQGHMAFTWLAWLAFLYALTAGPRSTADCLSEEKREGTLGLLFLTDLKGRDVVLGKMAATSLNTFYGLLAMLPVLAIPLLMGGVTAAAFWRTVLALLNGLFVSLALGLFISSISRVDRKAVSASVVLLLALTGGLPLAAVVVDEATGNGKLAHWIALASPGYAFALAQGGGWGRNVAGLWQSLGLNVALCGLLLAGASRLVLRVWRDKPVSGRRWRWHQRWRNWIFGPPHHRAALRRRLLDINPVLWLSSRQRWVRYYPWFFLVCMGLIWLWGSWWDRRLMLTGGALVMGYITNAVLKYWMATVAAHGFAADRDQGALELLLSTPLRVDELIRGQRLALRRLLGAPVAVTAGIELVVLGIAIWQYPELHDLETWAGLMVANVVLLIADSWAVAWMGMWLGIRLKKANKAASSTASRVLALPWLLAVTFGLSASRAMSQNVFWPTLVFLSLLVDLLAGLYARQRLRNEMRRVATERYVSAMRTFLGLPLKGSGSAP